MGIGGGWGPDTGGPCCLLALHRSHEVTGETGDLTGDGRWGMAPLLPHRGVCFPSVAVA